MMKITGDQKSRWTVPLVYCDSVMFLGYLLSGSVNSQFAVPLRTLRDNVTRKYRVLSYAVLLWALTLYVRTRTMVHELVCHFLKYGILLRAVAPL